MTTSTAKRRALAELAAEHGFAILEDIPYRELRYHGETPPTIGELAGDARVITLGSLSKVLSPGLRIGYAIADPETPRRRWPRWPRAPTSPPRRCVRRSPRAAWPPAPSARTSSACGTSCVRATTPP